MGRHPFVVCAPLPSVEPLHTTAENGEKRREREKRDREISAAWLMGGAGGGGWQCETAGELRVEEECARGGGVVMGHGHMAMITDP